MSSESEKVADWRLSDGRRLGDLRIDDLQMIVDAATVSLSAPDSAMPGWPKRYCATSRKQNWRWSKRGTPMSPL